MSANIDYTTAFPQSLVDNQGRIDSSDAYGCGGMSLQEYAAIHLRVPNSGKTWLDEMIKESLAQEAKQIKK